MTSVLLADIGGSSTRFAMCKLGGRPEGMVVIDNETVSGPEAAIRRYLDKSGVRPQCAVLGVAGPVDGEEVRLTNRPWRFNLERIRSRFGLTRVHAINDFEALAYALANLHADELAPLGRATGPRHGPKVVLGPGTGLGVAALLPRGDDWVAVASEGGHVSFGPASAQERVIFERIDGSEMITAETVISGPGLERIYRAANPSSVRLEARTIVAQAKTGHAGARAAVQTFVGLLGRFAGDVALTFKAIGGVYLAGGVALKIGDMLDPALFRAAFENHPPYKKLLATIPTSLITCPEPGLIGCAVVAQQVMGSEPRNTRAVKAG